MGACRRAFDPGHPLIGARIGEWGQDPLQMYLSDVYTVTANLAGVPGLSVPVGKTSEELLLVCSF